MWILSSERGGLPLFSSGRELRKWRGDHSSIDISNIALHFGRFPAMKSVAVDFESGETVGIGVSADFSRGEW